VTQQNSASSEETASASEELSAQAQTLQETVSMFKTRANGSEQSSILFQKPNLIEHNQNKTTISSTSTKNETEFESF
jgi:methyl-accepting chemotaxis protein